MTSSGIVKKLWNYRNIRRDDGLSYQDYIEQLTFLLFPEDGRRAPEDYASSPGYQCLTRL
jgi:hypothetical protein